MAKITDCIVTYIAEDKSHGFALNVETEDSIYIPQSCIEKLNLQEFDEFEGIIKKSSVNATSSWTLIRGRFYSD